jgi:hypothetical protein
VEVTGMHNPGNRNLEDRYRIMTILWAAITGSCVVLFVLTKLVTPQNTSNGHSDVIVLALLVASFTIFGLSFVLKKQTLEQAIQRQNVAGVQTALIIALAMCEAICLLGLVAFFAFSSPYYYAFFIIGAVGLLLHFPKRAHLYDATHKR